MNAIEQLEDFVAGGAKGECLLHGGDDAIAVGFAVAVLGAGDDVGNGVAAQVGIQPTQVLPDGIHE
ncbi:MAG: hypothetical protein CFK48_07200 [Armatimonadetes bacterium CP1_7O]|nr:MAG: hypothetical protein CFK48_07200 [Armatimonadetes bacterium CP1_7O]